MANDFSASKAKYWSRRVQRKFFKTDVYRDIASFEEQANLKKGVTVSRPSRSDTIVRTLGSDGSYLTQDLSDADETLTIDQEKYAAFYIKDLDRIQVNYDVMNTYADDQGKKLSNKIDSRVLREVLNVPSIQVIDDGDLGGTAGNGISLSDTNVDDILTLAGVVMDENEIPDDQRFGVIMPRFAQKTLLYLGNKATGLGDETVMRGRLVDLFNFNLHKSSNLTWTGELVMSVIPVAGDTVTINTVVFTFRAAIAAAGDVLLGANVAASRVNLTAAINGSAGAGTLYTELSDTNRNKLSDITATNDIANTKITIIAEGRSFIRVAETITDAADVWTPAKQISHNLFGRKGAIDVVVQKNPTLEIKDVSGKLGKDVITWCAFGVHTFAEGLLQLADLQIRTDSF